MRYIKQLRWHRDENEGENEDAGFTLIELLVVVLIIGVLLGIAVPTYLSVTSGAKTNAAESNLQSALTAAKTYYTNNGGSYTTPAGGTSLFTSLQNAGTGLQYNQTGSSDDNTVFVYQPSATEAVLIDADGANCYAVMDYESSGQLTGTSGVTNAGTWWAKVSPLPSSGCTNSAFGATVKWVPSASQLSSASA